MRRWIFGHMTNALHAAAENGMEFIDGQHRIAALCDGLWRPFTYADFGGKETMPVAWHPAVRICEGCRLKWAPGEFGSGAPHAP